MINEQGIKMKLKTLKDFEERRSGLYVNGESKVFAGYYADTGELKQEAIKWVKYLQNYLDTTQFGNVNQYCTEHEQSSAEGKIVWIKQFFNITEEKLSSKCTKTQGDKR